MEQDMHFISISFHIHESCESYALNTLGGHCYLSPLIQLTLGTSRFRHVSNMSCRSCALSRTPGGAVHGYSFIYTAFTSSREVIHHFLNSLCVFWNCKLKVSECYKHTCSIYNEKLKAGFDGLMEVKTIS